MGLNIAFVRTWCVCRVMRDSMCQITRWNAFGAPAGTPPWAELLAMYCAADLDGTLPRLRMMMTTPVSAASSRH